MVAGLGIQGQHIASWPPRLRACARPALARPASPFDGPPAGASELNQARTHNRANELYNSTPADAIQETAGQAAWALIGDCPGFPGEDGLTLGRLAAVVGVAVQDVATGRDLLPKRPGPKPKEAS